MEPPPVVEPRHFGVELVDSDPHPRGRSSTPWQGDIPPDIDDLSPGNSQGTKGTTAAITRNATPTICESPAPRRQIFSTKIIDREGHHRPDVHHADRYQDEHQAPAATDAVQPVMDADPKILRRALVIAVMQQRRHRGAAVPQARLLRRRQLIDAGYDEDGRPQPWSGAGRASMSRCAAHSAT